MFPAQHQSMGVEKPRRDVSVAFKSDFVFADVAETLAGL